MAGQRHFDQGDDRATVGAIVIGEQQAVGIRRLDRSEKCAQARRIIDIWRQVAGAQ